MEFIENLRESFFFLIRIDLFKLFFVYDLNYIIYMIVNSSIEFTANNVCGGAWMNICNHLCSISVRLKEGCPDLCNKNSHTLPNTHTSYLSDVTLQCGLSAGYVIWMDPLCFFFLIKY